jgi:hypothetical protein
VTGQIAGGAEQKRQDKQMDENDEAEQGGA